MNRTTTRAALFAIAGSVALTAATAAHADWRKKYPTVSFGVTTGENAADSLKRWTPFVEYMSKATGVKWILRQASDYAGIIEAMAAKKVEMAWYGGAGYAKAYKVTGGNVQPLAMEVGLNGKSGYHSVIVVRKDSPAQKLEDLKGKTLAFADPNSTSGFLVPSYALTTQGKYGKGINFFKKTGFSGSHENGVLAVIKGTWDAAATWMYDRKLGNLSRMAGKGMIKMSDVRIIWMSPQIPNSPFTVRKDLPEEMKQTIKTALFAFPKADPKRWAVTSKGNFSGFAPASHKTYEFAIKILELKARMKKKKKGS